MRDRVIRGWRSPGLLNYLLLPVSLVYRILVAVRYWAYRVGVCRSYGMSVPVLVVGGLTVGGVGKTPVVMELVRYLKDAGFNPGVISRGYGGSSPFWPREVGTDTTPEMVGDEPQLIYEQCQIPVVVGPDRIRSGHYLIDRCNCDVIISDDGYQHYRLKRDMDVVVVDGEWGFGNGWCLPAGPLREPVSALSRADVVVLNGDKLFDAPLPSHFYQMRSRLSDGINLATRKIRPLSEFKGQRVHGVAAIGNPNRFFSQLRGAGLEVATHPFPDHHFYSEQDLSHGNSETIMMTEKDGIKCRAMKDLSIARNIWIVPAVVTLDPAVFIAVDEAMNVEKLQ